MKNRVPFALVLCGVSLLFASSAVAGTVSIGASKDNSLYEDTAGAISNGAGEYLFTGKTAMGALRRGLIEFDVAGNVPAGATIDSVSLTLNMSMTIVGGEPVSLHRALQEWGESSSDAFGEEGIGADAERGDATWIHAILGTALWDNAGGDFDAVPSSTESVSGAGPYTWTGMEADVQAWLDDPSGNHGWVIIGNEDTQPTAKRFDSRENATEANRPVLTIEFTEAPAVPAASTWGVAVAAITLLIAGTLALRRRTVRAS